MEQIKEFFGVSLMPFVIALIVTLIIGPVFIPWLRKLKFGQEIREEGPKWHQKKSGTPTMGGIMFIVGIVCAVIVTVIFYILGNHNGFELLKENPEFTRLLLITFTAVLFGGIGFLDDYIKVVKKRNLGLTAIQKFMLQVVCAGIYVALLYTLVGGRELLAIMIPFTPFKWEMPMWLYIPFVMFVVVGVVNAVNLTDGLDGLASSVTSVVAIFFVVVSYAVMKATGVTIFAAALLGGLIGFLYYNKYPAKVFMGDTGSLFLGAAVALMAIDMQMPIFLIIVGFVYFMETLSVIMQTTYFKITKKKYGEGRRIFKMTPIHHHFEMSGWTETNIVAVFSFVTAILCIVAGFGIVK